MKNLNSLWIILSFFLIVSGCTPETATDNYMPTASGKPGSILVVVDSAKFNRNIGLEVKKKLSRVYKGLPQPEPLFEITDIHPPAFKKIFQKHRNILKIEVAEKYTQTRLLVRNDVYAKPQLFIHAQAPNDSAMVQLFRQKGDVVVQKFLQAERERYIKTYKGMANKGAMMRVEEKFDISLVIPKGYSLDVDTTNFVWIESEGRHYSQNLLVYEFPYVGKHSLSRGYLLKKRDDFTKRFVPGSSPNSYMITEDQVVPFYEVHEINGNEVIIMRGLWKVEGDFMGGPFVSASIYKPEKNSVVVVEGFVYAPRFDKRNYVRQLEAILYTLDLVNKKE